MENGDMANNENIWSILSSEEQRSIWEETESSFWPKWIRDHEQWRVQHEQTHNKLSTELRVELSSLGGQRDQLRTTQERLARELAKVEQDLSRVNEESEAKSNELARLDQDCREELEEKISNYESHSSKMKNFFREKLGRPIEYDQEGQTKEAQPTMQLMERFEEANRPPSPSPPHPHGDVLANVVDADNNIIGPVERVEPWNQWVEAILRLPVQRTVRIRRGRRFNEDHLATIYDRAEGKGVKWLSCMIQAIGKIQSKRCQSCDKNQGAFEQCIIVGGRLLQKCGNCEWNRQGCHGASGETIDGLGSEDVEDAHALQLQQERELENEREMEREMERDREREKEREKAERLAMDRKAREERERLLSERLEQDRREQEYQASRAMMAERRPHPTQPGWIAIRPNPSLTGQSSVLAAPRVDSIPILNGSPSGNFASIERVEGASRVDQITAPPEPPMLPAISNFIAANTSSFTPANASSRSRPPSRQSSREFLTPTAQSVEPSPQRESDEPLEDITRDNLILRHNGEVYTYPECVEGVPLAKIDQNHPYWDPEWKDLRAEVDEARTKWEIKLQGVREAIERQESVGSIKYQIGRQINRGTKILEFMDTGTISPYQLLAKKYMHSTKGGITSYDTLFRLCETLSELSRFKIDVTPVEWMRHRLHEIKMIKGNEFNVSRTVHDFYHDKKLTALRVKHGFKNIGRPSGVTRQPRQSVGSNGGTPKQSRKRLHADTPPEASWVSLGDPLPGSPDSSFNPTKRNRTIPMDGDAFATDTFSDKDSVSGSPIFNQEYRLYQVKHRQFASSTKSSQYWAWQPDRGYLEHQVMKAYHPRVEWGVIKKPVDFGFKLDEVAEIIWNLQALRVYIKVNASATNALISPLDDMPRGDIMAWFKRERTMKRFLAFCRHMKVSLVRETTEELDRRWEGMQSAEQLQEKPPMTTPAV